MSGATEPNPLQNGFGRKCPTCATEANRGQLGGGNLRAGFRGRTSVGGSSYCASVFLNFRLIAAAPSTLRPTSPEISVIGSGTSLGVIGPGQTHGGETGLGMTLGITTGGGTGGTTTTGGGTTGMIGEMGDTFTSSEPTGTGGKKAKAPDDRTVNAAHPNAAAGTFLRRRTTMMTTPWEIRFRTASIG